MGSDLKPSILAPKEAANGGDCPAAAQRVAAQCNPGQRTEEKMEEQKERALSTGEKGVGGGSPGKDATNKRCHLKSAPNMASKSGKLKS